MSLAAYADLIQRSKQLAVLNSAAAVLGWDQQTYMPKGGAAFRGEQLAALAALAHDRATDPKVGDLLAACEASDVVADPESVEAANVRELRHAYDRATKLPKALVEALARETTAAQETWQVAKAANTFATFRPSLETVLALKREEAAAVGYADHPYDALLDEYEPGATAATVRVVFAELSAALVPLIRAIADSGQQPAALDGDFPVGRQKLFAEAAAAAVGFDFHSGRLDTTAHPFCSAIGPGDCRLTTRYHPRRFAEAFFGVLHEAGHGMYEQGLPADKFGTPCGAYCSLGVHESQSRLWENQVGRSRPFWRHFFPRLKQTFPAATRDLTLDGLLAAVNAVRPSFIRTEADEVTYNLHVALRFEMELALLSGNLSVAELPTAWNDRFQQLFGLSVPDDASGCLQDIHWSFGGFGYFPTYTLGNLYAAQFMAAAKRDLGASALDDAFVAGNFHPLREWLTKHIYAHGRRYRAAELCRRITGAPLSGGPAVAHLREKFGGLYGVC